MVAPILRSTLSDLKRIHAKDAPPSPSKDLLERIEEIFLPDREVLVASKPVCAEVDVGGS